MMLTELPWLKIFATIIGVAIAIVEIWDFKKKRKNIKWQKQKKPIIITLTMMLLGLSIWDSIDDKSEEIEIYRLEEERRNIQIKTDSIRALNIINNLDSAIVKIDNSTENLRAIDSVLGNVRSDIKTQVATLNMVVDKSQELQNYEIGGDSFPIIVPLGVFSEMFDETKVRLQIVNIGNYHQKNVIVTITDVLRRNLFIDIDSIIENKWTYEYKVGDLPLSGITNRVPAKWVSSGLVFNVGDGTLIHEVELEKNQKNVVLHIEIRSNNGLFVQDLSISDIAHAKGYGLKNRMNLKLTRIGVGEILSFTGIKFPKIKNDSLPAKLWDPFKIYK